MTGQQLARQYYETLGRPALAAHFPALVPRMAVGLAGEGSECFGFDDALSRDHDWGAGFCIWLEEDDFRQYGAQVQAVYDSLPAEKAGFPIRRQQDEYSAGRVGCLCTQHWYRRYTGFPAGPETPAQWRRVPEAYLATVTNGTVFADPLGRFSAVREKLCAFYPEDVRLKKLAARAAAMAQELSALYQTGGYGGGAAGARGIYARGDVDGVSVKPAVCAVLQMDAPRAGGNARPAAGI